MARSTCDRTHARPWRTLRGHSWGAGLLVDPALIELDDGVIDPNEPTAGRALRFEPRVHPGGIASGLRRDRVPDRPLLGLPLAWRTGKKVIAMRAFRSTHSSSDVCPNSRFMNRGRGGVLPRSMLLTARRLSECKDHRRPHRASAVGRSRGKSPLPWATSGDRSSK